MQISSDTWQKGWATVTEHPAGSRAKGSYRELASELISDALPDADQRDIARQSRAAVQRVRQELGTASQRRWSLAEPRTWRSLAATAGLITSLAILVLLLVLVTPSPVDNVTSVITTISVIAVSGAAITGLTTLLIAAARVNRESSQSNMDQETSLGSPASMNEVPTYVTEHYLRLADALADDRHIKRVASLYELERLGGEYSQLRSLVFDLICAYLRMPNDWESETENRSDDAMTRDDLVTRDTAQHILKRHLQPHLPTYWPGMSLDLSRASLFMLDLEGCEIATLRFYDARFFGPTNFRHTTVLGEVDFKSAQFHRESGFDGVRFLSAADFSNATFSKMATFRESTITDSTSFAGARFEEGTNFSGVTFSGATDFSRANFAEVASFRDSTFTDLARFADARFEEEANFSGLTFSGATDFSRANFAEVASFRDSTFTDLARFADARFEEEANFSGVTFSGVTEFSRANFAEVASFRDSTFTDLARFADARFEEEANFSGVTFSGATEFSRANFAEVASFRDSTFTDLAGFADARIRGEMQLEGARFFGPIITSHGELPPGAAPERVIHNLVGGPDL
jgi:uncharacterized protein YjbI with pentapeptide repeats